MSDNATNVFLESTKRKLRCITPIGHLTTEDLWDLPLAKLDEMAVSIDSSLKGTTRSFRVNPDRKVSAQQADDQLRLAVLIAVIETKEADNAKKLAATSKKARLEFLTRLKEKKEIDQLESLSTEDIDKEIAALQEA